MKNPSRFALVLLLAGGFASAQTPAAKQEATEKAPGAGQVMDRQLANLEREFVPAAEAMPEAVFAFAPTKGEFKGVKTFAEQVKHVSAVNFFLGAQILGEKPPAEVGNPERAPTASRPRPRS